MSEDALRKHSRHTLAGRGAVGVDDPPPAVAALEAEPLVELHSELHEVADSRGSLLGQSADRARTRQVAARAERVLGVERRIVIVADCSCDPALRKRARRGEKRPLGEDEDIALGGSAERGKQSCDPTPDHDEVDVRLAMCP